MFILNLSHMQCAKYEYSMRHVVRAETREELWELLKKEWEPHKEPRGAGWGDWHKSFRDGGLLEWFNCPSFMFKCMKEGRDPTEEEWEASELNLPVFQEVASFEEIANRAVAEAEAYLSNIPQV